jgi:hypothetical protein
MSRDQETDVTSKPPAEFAGVNSGSIIISGRESVFAKAEFCLKCSEDVHLNVSQML